MVSATSRVPVFGWTAPLKFIFQAWTGWSLLLLRCQNWEEDTKRNTVFVVLKDYKDHEPSEVARFSFKTCWGRHDHVDAERERARERERSLVPQPPLPLKGQFLFFLPQDVWISRKQAGFGGLWDLRPRSGSVYTTLLLLLFLLLFFFCSAQWAAVKWSAAA